MKGGDEKKNPSLGPRTFFPHGGPAYGLTGPEFNSWSEILRRFKKKLEVSFKPADWFCKRRFQTKPWIRIWLRNFNFLWNLHVLNGLRTRVLKCSMEEWGGGGGLRCPHASTLEAQNVRPIYAHFRARKEGHGGRGRWVGGGGGGGGGEGCLALRN